MTSSDYTIIYNYFTNRCTIIPINKYIKTITKLTHTTTYRSLLLNKNIWAPVTCLTVMC